MDKKNKKLLNNKKGDGKMDGTMERKKLDFFNEEEIRNISKNLPVKKVRNGVILLDKNNPDDVEWWNEE